MGKGQVCERCRFFEKADSDVGLCRRYAPTRSAVATTGLGVFEVGKTLEMKQTPTPWPMVNTDDWCGEWVPRV